jgi:nicotinamide mononucleotide transporter
MIFGMSYLEIAANMMTVVCILLAGRNNIHTWWTGIVACVLFGVLFYQSQLYADVTLQVFFIATSVIGWYAWATKGPEAAGLPVNKADAGLLRMAVIGGAAVWLGYSFLLHKFTNAYLPFVDGAVMVLSIIAQLLLMRRSVENWPTWVLVNIISVPLYMLKDLKLTAFLYFVFLINAGISWKHWLNLFDDQRTTPTEAQAALGV